MPPEPLAVPQRLPWATFEGRFDSVWRQGQHVLLDGPNGSGKTVLARVLARLRQYVVVLGTKPVDDEMDAYLAEGYTRIDTWPPPRSAMRPVEDPLFPDGSVRLLLWPKIRTRQQLRSFRPVYAKALDEIFIKGRWTIVADEGLWLTSRTGLALGTQLDAIAYGSRSAKVTLMMLAQRPRGLPVNTWTNAQHAFLWHMGNTDDVRELASIGTVPPKAVVAAVQSLRGFDFVYLPCRARLDWAISTVDPAVI